MVEGLYVTFSVRVSDSERTWYSGKTGEASMDISLIPRPALENIDASVLLRGLLQAALLDFDSKEEEEASEG